MWEVLKHLLHSLILWEVIRVYGKAKQWDGFTICFFYLKLDFLFIFLRSDDGLDWLFKVVILRCQKYGTKQCFNLFWQTSGVSFCVRNLSWANWKVQRSQWSRVKMEPELIMKYHTIIQEINFLEISIMVHSTY